MATLIFRCPVTSKSVQAWFADDPSENGGEAYEPVTCAACSMVHLINPKTGMVLGGEDE